MYLTYKATLSSEELSILKNNAVRYSKKYKTACILDSNNYPFSSWDFDLAIAYDSLNSILVNPDSEVNAFDILYDFHKRHNSTLFGFLSYDLKNDIYTKLHSKNIDETEFPVLFFFMPKILILVKGSIVEVKVFDKKDKNIILKIIDFEVESIIKRKSINFVSRVSKDKYINSIEQIKKQIKIGDFYEMNYCQEFYADDVNIDPAFMFTKLNTKSKAPFSSFLKFEDKYVISLSPERFLKKKGDLLISQPIKGTIKRGNTNSEDNLLKTSLENSPKDKSENIMIVDLVRNDLGKVCKTGSVKVEEFCKVYPFNFVFQMISTISGVLREEKNWLDALKGAFPMGSMTGAPKFTVLENIENIEDSKRGIYSGSIGYIDKNGDFDFNVVIRSLVYNSMKKYLSYHVGGAIIYDSNPENEYQECLLKAKAMKIDSFQ